MLPDLRDYCSSETFNEYYVDRCICESSLVHDVRGAVDVKLTENLYFCISKLAVCLVWCVVVQLGD